MTEENDVKKPLTGRTLPRWWRVLPFLTLFMIITNIDNLILNDFIEHRFAIKYQVNSTSTQNARDLCLNDSKTTHRSTDSVSTTTSKYPLTTTLSPSDLVQAANARLNVYISLAATIPSLIAAVLLGANGDRIGRKSLIVFPYFGKVIRYFMLTAVAYYDLDDIWIIISVMLDSVFGTAALNILSAYAYLTDCTTEKNRTPAIIVGEVCIGSSRFIPLVTLGIYLQHPNFVQSMLFTLILSLAGLIAGFILQPESNLNVQHLNIFQQLRLVKVKPMIDAFRVFFIKREGHKRRTLLLLVSIHLLIIAMVCGQIAIYYIYLYGAPFCFDSFDVSLNSVVQAVFVIILTIPFTLIVFKRTDHLILPVLGTLSYIAQLILFAVATQTWILYLAVCIGSFYSVLTPVIRSRITKIVEPSEYAMVFILAMILESGGYYAISAFTNEIYQASVTFLPGLVFYVISLFGVAGIVLMM